MTPAPARTRHRRLTLALASAGLGALALAVSGVMSRQRTEARLASWTAAQAVPSVRIVMPTKGGEEPDLVLPGDIEAWYEAAIHARVSGYLKSWQQDIGAKVQGGETLATIDTPELDQQLEQARNDLVGAEASATLAELTAKRWKGLLTSQAVSQQAVDEKTGDAAAKRAAVAAAKANVDRLLALESFKRLAAPFDGVVTARDTDIGALISAGGGNGVPLFKVADIHRMRVYVRVPQSYSGALRPGLHATLKLAQYPGRSFNAVLATTSNAVARESRTVLAELQADNPDGALWPGTFAEVHFHIPGDAEALRLPASALLFRARGLEVATLGPDDHVVMKPITAGRDLGAEIEVRSGIGPRDRVIDSPSDSLSAGDLVRPTGGEMAQAAGAGGE